MADVEGETVNVAFDETDGDVVDDAVAHADTLEDTDPDKLGPLDTDIFADPLTLADEDTERDGEDCADGVAGIEGMVINMKSAMGPAPKKRSSVLEEPTCMLPNCATTA